MSIEMIASIPPIYKLEESRKQLETQIADLHKLIETKQEEMTSLRKELDGKREQLADLYNSSSTNKTRVRCRCGSSEHERTTHHLCRFNQKNQKSIFA